MVLFVCENATLGYGNRLLQRNLSFCIREGDYLCVMGENGTGKTTLMKTCLGLLPPLFGRVALGDAIKATEIGYLPQQTAIQRDFPASCREIVLSGCLNRCGKRPFYGREAKARAEKNLERMGIGHLAKRCYNELSGGQQQRVLLARALCAAGKLLLLDEPAAGLDAKAAEEMYALIKQLNGEGIAIMMITHDIQAVLRHTTHILDMGKQPAFFGTPKEYESLYPGMRHQEVCHE